MIDNWRSHADCKRFMLSQIDIEFQHNLFALDYFYPALLKMNQLDLDSVKEDFSPLFSSKGRPSNPQPELFRFIVLMAHFKYASVDDWAAYASVSVR